MKSIFIFLVVLLLSIHGVAAQTQILFAGNSYTYYNDMPLMVKQIAEANGLNVEIKMSVNGGVSLKDHWEGNMGLETKALIQKENYDFVVIQDQSMTPIKNPEKTLVYGKKLASLVNKKGGQLIIFQTWSRKSDPSSQIQLDQTFAQLKQESQGIIAPVADAWHLAKKEYPSLELYSEDGSHPSEKGSYLTALVFYLTLWELEEEGFETINSKRMPLLEMKQCEWIANQIMKD